MASTVWLPPKTFSWQRGSTFLNILLSHLCLFIPSQRRISLTVKSTARISQFFLRHCAFWFSERAFSILEILSPARIGTELAPIPQLRERSMHPVIQRLFASSALVRNCGGRPIIFPSLKMACPL